MIEFNCLLWPYWVGLKDSREHLNVKSEVVAWGRKLTSFMSASCGGCLHKTHARAFWEKKLVL
jgi:hypothetical protein